MCHYFTILLIYFKFLICFSIFLWLFIRIIYIFLEYFKIAFFLKKKKIIRLELTLIMSYFFLNARPLASTSLDDDGYFFF